MWRSCHQPPSVAWHGRNPGPTPLGGRHAASATGWSSGSRLAMGLTPGRYQMFHRGFRQYLGRNEAPESILSGFLERRGAILPTSPTLNGGFQAPPSGRSHPGRGFRQPRGLGSGLVIGRAGRPLKRHRGPITPLFSRTSGQFPHSRKRTEKTSNHLDLPASFSPPPEPMKHLVPFRRCIPEWTAKARSEFAAGPRTNIRVTSRHLDQSGLNLAKVEIPAK